MEEQGLERGFWSNVADWLQGKVNEAGDYLREERPSYVDTPLYTMERDNSVANAYNNWLASERNRAAQAEAQARQAEYNAAQFGAQMAAQDIMNQFNMQKYAEEERKKREAATPEAYEALKKINDDLFVLKQDPEVNKVAIADAEEMKAKLISQFPSLAESADWKAREEMRLSEVAAKQKKEAEAKSKELEFTKFLTTIPTTFKNDAAKKAWAQKIFDNPDGTDEEKASAVKSLLGIESGATATAKAVQGAVAGSVGKAAGGKVDEKFELEDALKAAKPNQKQREILKKNGYHYDITTGKWVK